MPRRLALACCGCSPPPLIVTCRGTERGHAHLQALPSGRACNSGQQRCTHAGLRWAQYRRPHRGPWRGRPGTSVSQVYFATVFVFVFHAVTAGTLFDEPRTGAADQDDRSAEASKNLPVAQIRTSQFCTASYYVLLLAAAAAAEARLSACVCCAARAPVFTRETCPYNLLSLSFYRWKFFHKDRNAVNQTTARSADANGHPPCRY